MENRCVWLQVLLKLLDGIEGFTIINLLKKLLCYNHPLEFLNHGKKSEGEVMFDSVLSRLGVVVFLTATFFSAPCEAATWTVHADGSGDFPNIETAVQNAANGDVIELTSGTFTGSGNTDVSVVDKALTLRSQTGNPSDVTIDCQAGASNPHRALMVYGGGSGETVIEGLKIINGYGYQAGINAAGAILISAGSNTIVRNCIFENNHVGMSWNHAGGAVYVDSHSAAQFEGCVFTGNSAFFGGAVGVNHFSTAAFDNCRFLDNEGGRGGAIWGNSTRKTHCLFARNTADEGGAVWGNGYNEEYSANCTYSENSASLGGAIYAYANYGSPVILMDTIIANSTDGAAVWAAPGVVVQIFCSDLYGNAGGDWVGAFAGLVDMNGNFSANPCFCAPENDDYQLCGDSYCLPGNHPWGCDQLVGAYDQGCAECLCDGPVSTESSTWGELKAWYR